MSIILASRGVINQTTFDLLKVLPLAVSYVVVMNVCQKRRNVQPPSVSGGADFSDIHSKRIFTTPLESDGIHSEGVVKIGRLVKEVSNAALAQNSEAIILVEDSSQTNKLKLLASDGLAVLKKTGKPVLLQPSGCLVRDTGSILVAIPEAHHSSESQWHLERTMNLRGREAVVLSVSSPFYPLFGRVAVGMRAYQSEALHEIWDEQAGQGALTADLLAGRLKEAGAKSWYVSRTGKFTQEILKTAQSVEASFTCILVDPAVRRRWFRKSELADLLEVLGVPIMLVPCEKTEGKTCAV